MQERIRVALDGYEQERNALITEATERMQRQQMANAEHNARIAEIQTRVAQIEGATQALREFGADGSE